MKIIGVATDPPPSECCKIQLRVLLREESLRLQPVWGYGQPMAARTGNASYGRPVSVISPKRLPQMKLSETKSRDQRWFGPCGIFIGARVPSARLRPLRRRTRKSSSR